MTDGTSIEETRASIRAAAHAVLRAKRRRRTLVRTGSAAAVVGLIGLAGAAGWWTADRGGLQAHREEVTAGAAAHGVGETGVLLQIVSLVPEPVEHVSDDDLARALRAAGSPYGLVISEGGVRAVPNRRGL